MLEHQVITRTTLALAVLMFASEAGAAAQLTAFGAAEGIAIPGVGIGRVVDPASTASVISETARQLVPSAATLLQLYARVGALAATSESEANSSGFVPRSDGSVSWSDDVTMLSGNPALAGTPGSFVFRASLGGNGTALPTGPGFFREAHAGFEAALDVNLLNFRSTGSWQYVDGLGGSFSGDAPLQIYAGTVNFVFGRPFGIGASLRVSSSAASASGLVESSADLGSTLTWDGITEVRDAAGALVSDFSVASASGVDWSQAVAVPEPTNVLFMLASLPLVLWAAWRRSRLAERNVGRALHSNVFRERGQIPS